MYQLQSIVDEPWVLKSGATGCARNGAPSAEGAGDRPKRAIAGMKAETELAQVGAQGPPARRVARLKSVVPLVRGSLYALPRQAPCRRAWSVQTHPGSSFQCRKSLDTVEKLSHSVVGSNI